MVVMRVADILCRIMPKATPARSTPAITGLGIADEARMPAGTTHAASGATSVIRFTTVTPYRRIDPTGGLSRPLFTCGGCGRRPPLGKKRSGFRRTRDTLLNLCVLAIDNDPVELEAEFLEPRPH